MTKFKVVLERTDTITKHAELMVEAASADEARLQIAADLETDPGAYDDDLEPVEDGVGEITLMVENQRERLRYPRAAAGRRH